MHFLWVSILAQGVASHRVHVLSWLPWFPLGEWTTIWLVLKTSLGGLLDRDPSRCDPTCGQRKVAGDISETDSEGNVLEAPAALGEQGETGRPDCPSHSSIWMFSGRQVLHWDVLQECQIDDYWSVYGDRQRSGPRATSTLEYIFTKYSQWKENQHWAKEKPKLRQCTKRERNLSY